jgi:hypothetical protein
MTTIGGGEELLDVVQQHDSLEEQVVHYQQQKEEDDNNNYDEEEEETTEATVVAPPSSSSNTTTTTTSLPHSDTIEDEESSEDKERRRLEKEEEEKRIKRAKDRRQVEMEMLGTERDYVNNLIMCYDAVIKPIKESLETNRPILKQDDYETMFLDIELIIPVNKEVLKSLQECFLVQKEIDEKIKNGEQVTIDAKSDTVGKIFLRMTPYLKSYTTFCNKYDQIYKMYESLKETRKPFRKFLERVEYQPEVKYQALPSFLILPVQRIPRYNLLLRVS